VSEPDEMVNLFGEQKRSKPNHEENQDRGRAYITGEPKEMVNLSQGEPPQKASLQKGEPRTFI